MLRLTFGLLIGVLLLSGGYLASLSGAMKQGWIPATLLAIAVALLLGIALIMPRMNKIRKCILAMQLRLFHGPAGE